MFFILEIVIFLLFLMMINDFDEKIYNVEDHVKV